jgi:hypothetical protein
MAFATAQSESGCSEEGNARTKAGLINQSHTALQIAGSSGVCGEVEVHAAPAEPLTHLALCDYALLYQIFVTELLECSRLTHGLVGGQRAARGDLRRRF